MTASTDRATFRDVLAQAAEQARLLLPQAVNGRIESAVKLVLGHDVEPQADGSILVGSSSDPMKQYRLEGATCTCQDYVHGKDTEGWCQHRIAANLLKSVERVLARRAEPEPAPAVILPAEMEVFPDNESEGDPEPQPSAPAVPLPEAPASVNVRVQIAGREVQWTLRDTDEARLAVRLEALLARYPVPQAPQPVPQATAPQLSPAQFNALATHRPITGVCAIHQAQMQWNEGRDGRPGWYSHRTAEGQWCQGKGVRP